MACTSACPLNHPANSRTASKSHFSQRIHKLFWGYPILARKSAVTHPSKSSLPPESLHGYNSHEEGNMRTVNVAELKNRLSKYLTFVKAGQEVVIRDRNLPVAKLIPFSAGDANDQELLLVAAGKLRLPSVRLDIKELLKIRTGTVSGNKAIRALQADRDA